MSNFFGKHLVLWYNVFPTIDRACITKYGRSLKPTGWIKSVREILATANLQNYFRIPGDNVPSEYVDKVCSMMRLYVSD